MDLVDQVRPDYDRGQVIDHHNQRIKEIQDDLRKKNKSDKNKVYPGPVSLLAIGLNPSGYDNKVSAVSSSSLR